ncbi:hypothetical protein SAMN05216474_0545 [Lishizhenia tianjinensis]|uniref:Uncharacterized protein n=1 Tax=Lishizhenia tianjinensis TaxID=477690 RepID=A0A1I6XZ75_9FLAO|nr:hypothetical protein [Lishizhenia tianjinensis]SFT43437.1 hypothetical protein SAMN05216474_0545 [Lishizhenia tianjinensis]
MRHILTVILLLCLLDSFGMRPSKGFYQFHDPISSIKPVWKTSKQRSSYILASSSIQKKNKYLTSLNYYDPNGELLKIESWIENRKKKTAKLVFIEEYTNRNLFDSVQGFQVSSYETESYYYYDSVKFINDSTLGYRLEYSVDIISRDTFRTEYNLTEIYDDIKKYKVITAFNDTCLYTYHNNRPIYVNRSNYSDSIVYDDFENHTIATYYFKGNTDSLYFIGQMDSISNNLIYSRQRHERYYPHVMIRESYFYDSLNRLVLKTENDYHCLFIYNGVKTIEISVFPHGTYRSINIKYKKFPFEGWTIKERLTKPKLH